MVFPPLCDTIPPVANCCVPGYLITTIPDPPLPATFDSGSVPPPPPPVFAAPDSAFDELFGHPVIARELPLPPPPSPPLPA